MAAPGPRPTAAASTSPTSLAAVTYLVPVQVLSPPRRRSSGSLRSLPSEAPLPVPAPGPPRVAARAATPAVQGGITDNVQGDGERGSGQIAADGGGTGDDSLSDAGAPDDSDMRPPGTFPERVAASHANAVSGHDSEGRGAGGAGRPDRASLHVQTASAVEGAAGRAQSGQLPRLASSSASLASPLPRLVRHDFAASRGAADGGAESDDSPSPGPSPRARVAPPAPPQPLLPWEQAQGPRVVVRSDLPAGTLRDDDEGEGEEEDGRRDAESLGLVDMDDDEIDALLGLEES